MTPLQLFLQQLVNGLTLGAIYALIALGYTMVYGVIQLINFAHGEVFMVGAYCALTALWVCAPLHLVPWLLLLLAALAAVAGCGALGYGIERVAYRPLRAAPRLTALITAIGMSFFLQNAVMLRYTAMDQHFPAVIPAWRWAVGGLSVSAMQLIIAVTAGVLMASMQWLVMRTTLGTAMRATAQDLKAAQLMGIPANRVIALTFIIGSALAAVGGMLFGLYYNTINFHDGYLTGLKAFTAAVLGGIGNIPGAMVGGIVLGLLEGLGAGYLSAQWKHVFAFVILVLLLWFKPTGLLGERVGERA